MFYLSTPYVNRHPQNHATWQNSKIRLIEYLQSRAPECRKIPSSTITAQVNTYNNQTIQLQVTFHTNQSPEFTILPIDLPENRWKPLDIPWSSNRFAWECPVYRLIGDRHFFLHNPDGKGPYYCLLMWEGRGRMDFLAVWQFGQPCLLVRPLTIRIV